MNSNSSNAQNDDNSAPAAIQSIAGNRRITMNNALIRAGHGLALSEKRLIACAVSKLDSRKYYAPNIVHTTQITAMEYADVFDVDVNTAYDQLQSGAASLYNRSITFFEPSYKRGAKDLPPTKTQMRWVGKVKYHEGEGWVELSWWPDLMRHLTGLKKQFTTYQLKQASALRSAYSWRLLELLSRFESTGRAEYSIEDFCASMDATEKQAADFGKVRTKIIEPAIKELCGKDGWEIEWTPIRSGRKVTALRFVFKREEQLRLL